MTTRRAMPMSMVDLYVAEVGKHLPEKNRADLEQEIRSLIQDAIEDAAEAQGREINEDLVVDVLKKFGSPTQVAASYGHPRYLIGPRLYPTYWTVLRIVLAIVLVISALGIGLQLGQEGGAGQSPLDVFIAVITGVLGSLMAAFGNVTLIFAILERLLPVDQWPKETWDPRQLKAEPDPQQVKLFDPVAGIVFTTLVLVVLNVYPQWIGITGLVNGEWVTAPVLAPAFFNYLPFINLLLAGEIVHAALLLQQGRWRNWLRWGQVGINLLWIALLGWMLAGPSLLQINPADLARLQWSEGLVRQLIEAAPALDTLFRLGVGVVLAAQVIEMGMHIYRILSRGERFKMPMTG